MRNNEKASEAPARSRRLGSQSVANNPFYSGFSAVQRFDFGFSLFTPDRDGVPQGAHSAACA